MRDRFNFMNKLFFRSHLHGHLLAITALLLGGIFSTTARGDFAAVGDVVSSLGTGNAAVDEAGGVANGLIIGDTGTGGLLADGVAPLITPPFLGPLISDSVIIGNQPGSIGAANIEDFIVDPVTGLPGNWIISADLVVGHAGQGFLDLLNAAGIGEAPLTTVGGTTYVGGGDSASPTAPPGLSGDPTLGLGVVRINGLGSRLLTQELVVGGEGVGVIDVSGRSSLITQLAASIGSTGTTGDATVSLTDLGTRWTAEMPVTIGGLAASPSSRGKVEIADQAIFQIEGVAGSLIINPRGEINFSGGTLRNLSSTPVANGGIIRGDGFINAALDINTSGELRNATTTGGLREKMLVSGAVTVIGNSNGLFDADVDGLIESQGGEMEFQDLVTNDGVIVARDAIMRFRGQELSGATTGLQNDGLFVLGQGTTIYGNITTTTGAIIVDLTNPGGLPPTSVFGDVIFIPGPVAATAGEGSAAMSSNIGTLKLVVDDSPGVFSILGDLDLNSNASFELDYASGVPAQTGDTFSVLSATNIAGDFANSQAIADGRFWDVSVIGNEVIVTATAQLVTSADFDGDLDIDGSDFLAWQRGFGDQYNGDDLANWEATYGTSAPPLAAASTAAIPEPSSIAMLLLGSVLIAGRRSRQAS